MRPLAGGTHARTYLVQTENPEREIVVREFPAGDDAAYWVVAASTADRLLYARMTPGFTAGTVEVRRRGPEARSTQIDVTYDLSALTTRGAAELDVFAAGYAHDIGAWEVAIETALAKESGR